MTEIPGAPTLYTNTPTGAFRSLDLFFPLTLHPGPVSAEVDRHVWVPVDDTAWALMCTIPGGAK